MFSTLLTLAGMFVAPAMAEEPAPIIAPNYLHTPYYFEGLDGVVQDDDEPEDSVR